MQKHTIKRISVLFMISFIFLASCGITEELDQLKQTTSDVQTLLSDEKKQLNIFEKSYDNIEEAMKKEQKNNASGTESFKNKEGDLWKNYESRKDFADNLAKQQRALKKQIKTLDDIAKTKAVDIPQESLKNYIQSLKLISIDQTALKDYMDQLLEEESTLYQTPDFTNNTDAINRVGRYYGAVDEQMEMLRANMGSTKEQYRLLQIDMQKMSKAKKD